MSPPGRTATSEPRVEQISAERVTDLSTRTQQMRYLVQELGVTRPQAHALLKAYEKDLTDVVRIGNDTQRSDDAFIDWLMRQVPGGRKPSVASWTVSGARGTKVHHQPGGWRTAS